MEIRLQDETEYYATRVEDIRPEGIVIAMPMRKAVPVFLSEGAVFEGKIIKNGVLYAFQSKLFSKTLSPLPVWVVSEPDKIRKIQLRSFVRLDIGLKASVWETDEEGVPLEDTHQSVITKNISAGGALVGSPVGYSTGTKVLIHINCDHDVIVKSKGVIVRSVPEFREAGELPLYSVGIEYLQLEERERRQVIQFINAKQIERRQRDVR